MNLDIWCVSLYSGISPFLTCVLCVPSAGVDVPLLGVGGVYVDIISASGCVYASVCLRKV